MGGSCLEVGRYDNKHVYRKTERKKAQEVTKTKMGRQGKDRSHRNLK
jgi:hypothetical protein